MATSSLPFWRGEACDATRWRRSSTTRSHCFASVAASTGGVELRGRRRRRGELQLGASTHEREALRGRHALGHRRDAGVQRREQRFLATGCSGDVEEEPRERHAFDPGRRGPDRRDHPVAPLARANGGHDGCDVVCRHERVVRVVLVHQLGEHRYVGDRQRRERLTHGAQRQPPASRDAQDSAAREVPAHVQEQRIVLREALEGANEIRLHVLDAVHDGDTEAHLGQRRAEPRDRIRPRAGVRGVLIPGGDDDRDPHATA